MLDNSTYKIKVRYYISFVDGQGVPQEEEISFNVFTAFKEFERENYRQQNIYTRHIEHRDLTDQEIYHRAANPVAGVDDVVVARVVVQKAIGELPETQRRRFILYYEYGLTYEEIARMEGCSKVAVKYTIDKASAEIKDKIKNFKIGA